MKGWEFVVIGLGIVALAAALWMLWTVRVPMPLPVIGGG